MRPTRLLQLAFACTLLLLQANSAQAVLAFTLSNPVQVSPPGATLQYVATLTNTLGTDTIYLNGFGYSLSNALQFDGSGFNDTPFYLSPGDSWTGLLFTVTTPTSTPQRIYAGSYLIYGGGDGSSYQTLATANYSVTIVPEPSTWAMLCFGVVGAGVVALRRRQTEA